MIDGLVYLELVEPPVELELVELGELVVEPVELVLLRVVR
jgi:hypothetical protein